MNISLTPQLEDFVKQKVATGLYNSTSEVMREALRLMQEQDELKAMKMRVLQQDLQQGLTQLDQGLSKPFDPYAIKQQAAARMTRS